MKLVLSRHGKSDKKVNKQGYPQVLGGSKEFDAPLVNDGRLQALALGYQLLQYSLNAAYSSSLIRSIVTAQFALMAHPTVQEAKPSMLLNERHFGALSGKYSDVICLDQSVAESFDEELLKEHLGYKGTDVIDYLAHLLYSSREANVEATNILTINSEFPKHGVESIESMFDRIDGFETYLKQNHNKDDTIAVFTHGDLIKCWLEKVSQDWDSYDTSTIKSVESLLSKGRYREVKNAQLYEVTLR